MTLDQLALILHHMLENFEVMPDGQVCEQRKRIDTIGGLKIEIYPNDHFPPHFHVRYAGKNASYKISDCSILRGSLGNKSDLVVCDWYKRYGRQGLEIEWEKLRPGDVIIGQSNK